MVKLPITENDAEARTEMWHQIGEGSMSLQSFLGLSDDEMAAYVSGECEYDEQEGTAHYLAMYDSDSGWKLITRELHTDLKHVEKKARPYVENGYKVKIETLML